MQFLKADTAVDIMLGPAVDKSDGVTLEAGLETAMNTASTGIRISKNGGAWADRNGTPGVGDASYDEGWYQVALDATDTNTEGTLDVMYEDATTCLPMMARFQVVNANVYDSLFAAATTDYLQVDAIQISGGSTAADNMQIVYETDFGTAYNTTRNAWATNAQDFVGTTASDPFNGQVIAASVTGAVGSVTGNVGGNVTGSVGSNLELGPSEVNAQCDTALSDIGLDHLISSALPTNWGTDVAAGSVFDNIADDGTASYDRTTDSLQAVRDHVGDGTNLTEAGGTGDHLTAIDLPNQTMDITGNLSGSVGSVTGAVGSVTGNVGGNVTGSVGSNLELGPAEVNAEVVDALATDTYTEPGQEAPGVNVSLSTKIGYLYKAWRNRSNQTATTYQLYADDGTTVDQKLTVSDDATTAEKGEVGTGP